MKNFRYVLISLAVILVTPEVIGARGTVTSQFSSLGQRMKRMIPSRTKQLLRTQAFRPQPNIPGPTTTPAPYPHKMFPDIPMVETSRIPPTVPVSWQKPAVPQSSATSLSRQEIAPLSTAPTSWADPTASQPPSTTGYPEIQPANWEQVPEFPTQTIGIQTEPKAPQSWRDKVRTKGKTVAGIVGGKVIAGATTAGLGTLTGVVIRTQKDNEESPEEAIEIATDKPGIEQQSIPLSTTDTQTIPTPGQEMLPTEDASEQIIYPPDEYLEPITEIYGPWSSTPETTSPYDQQFAPYGYDTYDRPTNEPLDLKWEGIEYEEIPTQR